MSRYRPIYVILHWISAALVFLAFALGLLFLANRPNDEAKLVPLGVHMVLGVGILVLTLARVVVRALMGRPAHRVEHLGALRNRKAPLLDILSAYVHPLLYGFTFLMAASGLWLAVGADLFAAALLRSEKPLPPDFYAFPARVWHGTLSLGLMLLIGQHLLAFVYHQFVRGENFIGRMWLKGKSKEEAD